LNLPGQQKDKFTPELRIIVASLLCMIVIFVWGKYLGPKPPTQPPQNKPVQTAPATAGSGTPATGSTAPGGTSTTAPGATAMGAPTALAPAQPASTAAKSDSQERTITVENALYHVEFSNRGAVVKSWQLKNYKDDAKPQRVLDLVHKDASQQTGGWPFSIILDDEQSRNAANNALYQVVSEGTSLHAPADVEFAWSDGHLEVTKHFHFDHTYVVQVKTSVKFNGKPLVAGLGWLGGFGDLTVTNPAPVETVSTYYSEGGKITSFLHKKLDGIEKWNAVSWHWQIGMDFAGIEDRYFTAAFLPPAGSSPGTLQTRYWKAWRNVQVNGQDTPEPVPQIAVASAAEPLALLRAHGSVVERKMKITHSMPLFVPKVPVSSALPARNLRHPF